MPDNCVLLKIGLIKVRLVDLKKLAFTSNDLKKVVLTLNDLKKIAPTPNDLLKLYSNHF